MGRCKGGLAKQFSAGAARKNQVALECAATVRPEQKLSQKKTDSIQGEEREVLHCNRPRVRRGNLSDSAVRETVHVPARSVYPTSSSGRATRPVKTVFKNTQKISTAELIAECVSRAQE